MKGQALVKNRFFVGLFLLVVFLVVNLLILIKKENFDDLQFVDKIGLKGFLNFGKSTKDISKLPFPLSQSLINENLFHKFKFKSFKQYSKKDLTYELTFDDKYCDEMVSDRSLYISKDKLLPVDFEILQRNIYSNSFYKKLLEQAVAKHKSKIPINRQWLRFGGSSVWLNDLRVHYMVSRLIFSPSGVPNKGIFSFLYVQIFDENWNELRQSLEVPEIIRIKQEGYTEDGYNDDVLLKTKISTQILQFPMILPIQFEYVLDSPYWGPEDPRIVKRNNPIFGFEEPVIVFNMKGIKLPNRVMYIYTPYSHDIKPLVKKDHSYANTEKNWTPFFSNQFINADGKGTSKLNFLYSLKPLEVLTCDIDTAICEFIQKADKDNINSFGSLRGGTQLESLPLHDLLPEKLRIKFPLNRQVYVGFARTHLNRCGCGESMYRPNLFILIEDFDDKTGRSFYKIGEVSDFLDFNVQLPPWPKPELDDNGKLIETKLSVCDDKYRSVLIPNSIAYWDIRTIQHQGVDYTRDQFKQLSESVESLNDLKYDDYLGVTLSAADSDVRIVHVKGLLNYILNEATLFDEKDVVQYDFLLKMSTDFNERCSELASKEYCIAYGKANPPILTEEEKKKQKEKEQKEKEQKEKEEKEQKEKEQKEKEEKEQKEKEQKEKEQKEKEENEQKQGSKEKEETQDEAKGENKDSAPEDSDKKEFKDDTKPAI